MDTVAGSVAATCDHASGTTFGFGTTTVKCSANDGQGNTAEGTFTVTVSDRTGPTFNGVPTGRQVEANGPAGSGVNYTLPTATDVVDGPIAGIVCVPASGSPFPLGTTTVTCTAGDSRGNVSSASFSISVGDSTPPALYLPADRSIVATSAAGISSSDPAVTGFLLAAWVVDIVDPNPIVIVHQLSPTLPVGVTPVTFEGRDAAGNKNERTARLTVLPPGSAPIPIPPAAKPPGNVTGLKVVVGNGIARLSWGAVAGAAKYIVYRSESGARRTSAEGHGQIVYEGPATTFTDRGLKNGTEYRYVVVSEDAAGNQAGGVATVAVPHRDLLRSPKDGASLKKAPKLIWAPDAEADYYNAQLLRNGVKILSVWPTRTSFTLHKSWTFQGRKYSLTPGLYKWYVWPGYGARSAVRYGELLGTRSFRVVR